MAEKAEHEGQVFDMEKGDWIDDPTNTAPPKKDDNPDKDKDKGADADDTDKDDVDSTDDKDQDKSKDKDTDAVDDADDADDKKKDDDADDPDKDDADDKNKDDDKNKEPELTDDQVDAVLKKKFGVSDQKAFKDILANNQRLNQELEDEKKKTKDPVFKSDQEKKLFEFLKPFDESNWGEGMQTAAELINLDPDKADGRKVMQEAFILSKPKLTRAEAIDLFNDNFADKYELKEKEEDAEDKVEYARKKRILEIKRKDAETEARAQLADAKEKLKAKPPEKKQDQPAVAPESVKQYSSQVDKFFDDGEGFKSFILPLGKDGKSEIKIDLTADQIKEMRKNMQAYVQRAQIYDKDGKIPNFDVTELALQVSTVLWSENGMPWILAKALGQVDRVAAVKKVEDLTKTGSTKKSKSKGDEVDFKNLDPEEQMRVLAERAKKQG